MDHQETIERLLEYKRLKQSLLPDTLTGKGTIEERLTKLEDAQNGIIKFERLELAAYLMAVGPAIAPVQPPQPNWPSYPPPAPEPIQQGYILPPEPDFVAKVTGVSTDTVTVQAMHFPGPTAGLTYTGVAVEAVLAGESNNLQIDDWVVAWEQNAGLACRKMIPGAGVSVLSGKVVADWVYGDPTGSPPGSTLPIEVHSWDGMTEGSDPIYLWPIQPADVPAFVQLLAGDVVYYVPFLGDSTQGMMLGFQQIPDTGGLAETAPAALVVDGAYKVLYWRTFNYIVSGGLVGAVDALVGGLVGDSSPGSWKINYKVGGNIIDDGANHPTINYAIGGKIVDDGSGHPTTAGLSGATVTTSAGVKNVVNGLIQA